MKILDNIKYRFSEEYRIFHHNIYIRLCFHKLFRYWFKERKNILKPIVVLYKGDTVEREFEYYMDYPEKFENKLFGFHIEPLGWKTKFGNIEYTHCPEIVCVINKKVRFTIRLESPETKYFDKEKKDFLNLFYWETILNHTIGHINKFDLPSWTDSNGNIEDPARLFYTQGVNVIPTGKIFYINQNNND